PRMSGLHEVDCSGCGRRHTLSAEQARKQRVLRCSCGQFVRMDRALPDVRSDPAPAPRAQPSEPARAPKPAPTDTDDEDDEQTHMLDSLSAIAALGNKAPRAPQLSLSGSERKSQPPPRASMRSLSPVPSKYNSEPPGDKPLWYVDLGGIETVEMTIEQLIIARRSGKLGEGALVWREGMPRWRPVGTLIPSSSAARHTPPPPPPPPPLPTASPSSPLPPPPPPAPIPSATSPASEPAPPALGSYERPLATLEFALEDPAAAAPRPSPRPAPPVAPAPLAPPVRERRASQPPRAATPVPGRLPTPLPARLPTPVPARRSTPVPARLPTPVPQPASWTSTSVVAPLPRPASSSVAAMSPVTLPPSGASLFASEQPRWLTVALAVLLCVAASGSGAFLVRSLRTHHHPLQLAPTTGSAALLTSSARPTNEPKAAPSAEPAPQVVDIASLSVERSVPRAAPRPVAVMPPKPAQTDESSDSDETEPAAAAAVVDPKPKTSDLPAAARSNPYSGATPDDGTPKQAPAPSSDAPGF
ncbi:MAG TPA: GYF domain-containing protein, partial [Polyangiaceae bacterium]